MPKPSKQKPQSFYSVSQYTGPFDRIDTTNPYITKLYYY